MATKLSEMLACGTRLLCGELDRAAASGPLEAQPVPPQQAEGRDRDDVSSRCVKMPQVPEFIGGRASGDREASRMASYLQHTSSALFERRYPDEPAT
jgi:SRSO17 transposase